MIVYYKLGNILRERGMKWIDLCNAGISQNMPTKFSQNKIVSMDTINKVCEYLQVQPGDIMDYIKDDNASQVKYLQAQISELQKQLDNL